MLKAFEVLDQSDDVVVARPGGVVQRDGETEIYVVNTGRTGKRDVNGGGVHGSAGRFANVEDDFPERGKREQCWGLVVIMSGVGDESC